MVLRHVFFTLIFCIAPTFRCFAQSHIAYVYDASGNRIRRELVVEVITKKQPGVRVEGKQERPKGELQADIEIDAEKAQATVVLHDAECRQATALLYTLSGQLLSSKSLAAERTYIDMSRQPEGVYLLVIWSSRGEKAWKISKR